jgi:hypothetical protein
MGYTEGKPLVAVTSPPYSDAQKRDRSKDASWPIVSAYDGRDKNISIGYQGIPDNIGNLPDKPLAAITSPPYQDTLKGGGGPNYYEFLQQAKGLSPDGWKKAEREWQRNHQDNMARYSQDDKNIGNLKDAELIGVTSPPFLEANTGGGINKKGYRGKHMRGQGRNQPDKVGERCGYSKDAQGVAEGQIGNLKDDALAGITSPPYESCDQAFHDESALKYIKGGIFT